jgi:hypothetical protein
MTARRRWKSCKTTSSSSFDVTRSFLTSLCRFLFERQPLRPQKSRLQTRLRSGVTRGFATRSVLARPTPREEQVLPCHQNRSAILRHQEPQAGECSALARQAIDWSAVVCRKSNFHRKRLVECGLVGRASAPGPAGLVDTGERGMSDWKERVTSEGDLES